MPLTVMWPVNLGHGGLDLPSLGGRACWFDRVLNQACNEFGRKKEIRGKLNLLSVQGMFEGTVKWGINSTANIKGENKVHRKENAVYHVPQKWVLVCNFKACISSASLLYTQRYCDGNKGNYILNTFSGSFFPKICPEIAHSCLEVCNFSKFNTHTHKLCLC